MITSDSVQWVPDNSLHLDLETVVVVRVPSRYAQLYFPSVDVVLTETDVER